MSSEEVVSVRKDDLGLIKFKSTGGFKNTEKFFKRIGAGDYMKGLEYYGEAGVSALMEATPKDTGKTAASWSYSINKTKDGIEIVWKNSNINDGVNIAMIIQQGHVTSSGYYIEGVDYINPALRPLFELMGKKAYEEVKYNADKH